MSDEWSKFVNDSRVTCKYGAKCYQKNPEHHKTYKHPPQNYQTKIKNTHKRTRVHPYAKVNKECGNNSESEIIAKVKESTSQDTTAELQSSTQENENIIVKLNKDTQFHEKDEDNKTFKELFLVEMPSDFFLLFKCLNEDNSIEKTLLSVNLQLIGPYDLLLGKLPVVDEKELYLLHWRFFYDPPEFQAVLKKTGKSEYHIGYYRDEPDSGPVFLGSSDSAKGCHIKPISENIFGAVYSYLKNEKKTSPFVAMACQKMMERVQKCAEEHNFSLEEYDTKKRFSKTVARTLHGAGIVVPYNKKTELGYRPLVESNANLKKLFAKLEAATTQREKDDILSEMQPVITYANIAMDECDFGTGLEIGIDLFCSGLKQLEANALNSLNAAYSLLNRNAFSKIIEIHLKHRRKGPDMSIF